MFLTTSPNVYTNHGSLYTVNPTHQPIENTQPPPFVISWFVFDKQNLTQQNVSVNIFVVNIFYLF